jgi:peptidoglycan hydrolase CwlO-like protein
MRVRADGRWEGVGMSTKVEDLVNRIRELSGDVEIQRFEIIGLRDDLEQRDARIKELEEQLEPKKVKSGG